MFGQVGNGIYQFIDFLWLPIAWFVAHPQHRWKTMAFILTCLITLRTQVQLMESTGFVTGFLPIMDSHVFPRGMLAYSVIILLFLVMAHFSPRTQGVIFFAASLSIYILAFCFSMLLMAL